MYYSCHSITDKLILNILQQPWLVDIESNSEEAKMTLDALHDQLVECQKKAAEYRNYQKLFMVTIYSLKETSETAYLYKYEFLNVVSFVHLWNEGALAV
jgi:hypothetical protein